MPNDTLNAELKYASAEDNTPGKPTRIQSWDIPEGTKIRLSEGEALIADFETTTGNAGPSGGDANPEPGTRLGLGYLEPNTPLEMAEVFAVFGVRPFNTLSIKEQQSRENAQNRTVRFLKDKAPNGYIELEDSDTLVLVALSEDEIDGSEMTFEYPMDVRND